MGTCKLLTVITTFLSSSDCLHSTPLQTVDPYPDTQTLLKLVPGDAFSQSTTTTTPSPLSSDSSSIPIPSPLLSSYYISPSPTLSVTTMSTTNPLSNPIAVSSDWEHRDEHRDEHQDEHRDDVIKLTDPEDLESLDLVLEDHIDNDISNDIDNDIYSNGNKINSNTLYTNTEDANEPTPLTSKQTVGLIIASIVTQCAMTTMFSVAVHQICVTNYHYDRAKLYQRLQVGITILFFSAVNLLGYLDSLLPDQGQTQIFKHNVKLETLYVLSEGLAALFGIYTFHRLLNSHVRLLYDTMSIVPPKWFHIHWILEGFMIAVTVLCHAFRLIFTESKKAKTAIYVFFVALGLEMLTVAVLLIYLMRRPKALLHSIPLTMDNRMEITVAKRRVIVAMWMAWGLGLVAITQIVLCALWFRQIYDPQYALWSEAEFMVAIDIDTSVIVMILSIELVLWIYKNEGMTGSEESICCLLFGCSCREESSDNSEDDLYNKLPIMMDPQGGNRANGNGNGRGGGGGGGGGAHPQRVANGQHHVDGDGPEALLLTVKPDADGLDEHNLDGLDQPVQKSSGEQKGPETPMSMKHHVHKTTTTVTDFDLLSSVTDLRSSVHMNQMAGGHQHSLQNVLLQNDLP